MKPDSSNFSDGAQGLAWFFARLGPWLRPYRGLALLAGAALLVDVVYESAFPLALKLLIDRAIVPRNESALLAISVGLIVLAALAALSDRKSVV